MEVKGRLKPFRMFVFFRLTIIDIQFCIYCPSCPPHGSLQLEAFRKLGLPEKVQRLAVAEVRYAWRGSETV